MKFIYLLTAAGPEIVFSALNFNDYVNGLTSNIIGASILFLAFILFSILFYWAIIYLGFYLKSFFESKINHTRFPGKKSIV